MKRTLFYAGLGMQLFGLAAVGICILSGMRLGDYGKIELVQFVGGAAIFYLGTGLKKSH